MISCGVFLEVHKNIPHESPGILYNPPPLNSLNVDICLALQTSCHLKADQLEKARAIMVEITERLGEDAHIAAITYADRAYMDMNLTVSTDDKRLARKIRLIDLEFKRCWHCKAQTHKALETCRHELIYRGRDDQFFPNVIVIFTDGFSFNNKFDYDTPKRKTKRESDVNKAEGIITIVGTFGDLDAGYNATIEWLEIHAPSALNGMRQTSPFGVMHDVAASSSRDIVHDILSQVPICSSPCNQFADIMLVLDRSDSIPVEDLDKTLNFFRDFIEQSVVNENGGLQFGILTYNSETFMHAQLREYKTKERLMAVIDRIPRNTSMYTETDDAIIASTVQLIRRPRLGARRIIIIATDGRSWAKGDKFPRSKATIDASKFAKSRGIDIFVVGLPNYMEQNSGFDSEWRFVGSHPIGCTVINMQRPTVTYDDLYVAGILLTNELCKPSLEKTGCIFKHGEQGTES
ncbi:unnamed protein product [Owenia fusiformis]|uniref:VWFA domain-containing protein n=1 Tax=Owenia fusiformis TaxID=6347 RepID=A0A8S4ND26_OWEFU|nr:unnamed protein product [Owenia fusiformis]